MKNILKSEKRQTISLLLLLLLVLFLNSTGINAYSLGGILGRLLGCLGAGIILGNIYFKLSRRERNEWQRWRVIMIIAFTFSLISSIPEMVSAFLSGFQEGYRK